MVEQSSNFPLTGFAVSPSLQPQYLNWQRAPTQYDLKPAGTRIQDNSVSLPVVYFTTGGGVWYTASESGLSAVVGTTDQIAVSTASGTATVSLSSTIVAPGTLSATTLTALTGNVTATNGNFVATASGTGLVLTPVTTSGTTTATANGRVGQVTITTPTIAAGGTAVMTIANTSITGSGTQVGYWLTGGTTGAALTIQSYANTANQSVVTIQNGTGATTNTASLILNFLVLN